MDEGERSLKDLFENAEKLRSQLEHLQASSEHYQTSLQLAINKYQACQELAIKVHLFSPNESIEDVATSDLKYLSIDYLIADLQARSFSGNRVQLLEKSQTAYTQYLGRIEDYDLLSKEQKALYERFLDNKSSFSILSSSDPSARRNLKIARFQQEKEIQQRIQYLNSNSQLEQDDDTGARELRLAELSLHTHQAFQALDMVAQEMKILSLAPSTHVNQSASPNDTRQITQGSNDDYSERLDLGLQSMLQNGKAGPLLSKSGRPLQPFTLLDTRARLRNGVFKPGHNLPTMTIDEYLEEERRRGGIIEGGGEPPVVEPNEDDLEAADRETMKAREWDEFVEANPKGSGNTLNRG